MMYFLHLLYVVKSHEQVTEGSPWEWFPDTAASNTEKLEYNANTCSPRATFSTSHRISITF